MIRLESGPPKSRCWTLLVAGTLAAASPIRAAPVETEARLFVPDGAMIELKATSSLPVLEIPAAPNVPLKRDTLLAAFDLTKLQKELDGARQALLSAQNERRRLMGADPTARASSRTNSVATRTMELTNTEADAMREIADVQTRMATAAIRAPEDGYVVKHLYTVGAKSQKRKPFLAFVEASNTRIETSMSAAEAAPFATGSTIRLSATTGEVKSFTGKVLAAVPAGDSVALTIQPLELPFLPLGTTARLALSRIP